MRRTLLIATLSLLVGSSLVSHQAWSHGKDESRPEVHHGYTECVDACGITVNVNQPLCMEITCVHGAGDVVISQSPNSWYYVPEFRTEGCCELTGWVNGWGGYETAVYNIHTSEKDTWAEVCFERRPDGLR